MRGKNAGFILVTVLLICVIGFCVAGTVKGQDRLEGDIPESWYREKETALLNGMREYLNGSGYRNCGVTLTRVVDADGAREYTFTIHHGKIDEMEEAGREALRGELAQTGLASQEALRDKGCRFAYDFLILETRE